VGELPGRQDVADDYDTRRTGVWTRTSDLRHLQVDLTGMTGRSVQRFDRRVQVPTSPPVRLTP
jgi:hypothetical protein